MQAPQGFEKFEAKRGGLHLPDFVYQDRFGHEIKRRLK